MTTTNKGFESKITNLNNEIKVLEYKKQEVQKKISREVNRFSNIINRKKREIKMIEADWRDWLLDEVKRIEIKKKKN